MGNAHTHWLEQTQQVRASWSCSLSEPGPLAHTLLVSPPPPGRPQGSTQRDTPGQRSLRLQSSHQGDTGAQHPGTFQARTTSAPDPLPHSPDPGGGLSLHRMLQNLLAPAYLSSRGTTPSPYSLRRVLDRTGERIFKSKRA